MLDQFQTIVVGVDGTAASRAAAAQARRLLAPNGWLVAVTVCEERLAVRIGLEAPRLAAEMHATAKLAQEKAAAILADLPAAETRLVEGRPGERLIHVAKEVGADLIAVGSHEHSRASGIILGSVASEILHTAPQSVLFARAGGDHFGTIVVGVDGSTESLGALTLARDIAHHEHGSLQAVVAEGGKALNFDRILTVAELDRESTPPVVALLDAGSEADIVVVGSRGLHGLNSLGSVSERVAHRAPCSVLVVRGAALTKSLDKRQIHEGVMSA